MTQLYFIMSSYVSRKPKRFIKRHLKRGTKSRKSGKAASSWLSRRAHPRTIYNPCGPEVKNVLPPRYVTRLTFAFTGFLSASNSYEFAVCANGLSLPGSSVSVSPSGNFVGAGTGTMVPNNQTLSTLQPNGFPLLALNYAQYRVRKSRMKFTGIPYYPNAGPVMNVVVPQNSSLNSTNGQSAQSRPYAVKRLVANQQTAKDAIIYNEIDMSSLWGITEAQFQGDEEFSAYTGANPIKLALWKVYSDQLYDNSSPFGASCEVEVTYEVEFWNPYNVSITN